MRVTGCRAGAGISSGLTLTLRTAAFFSLGVTALVAAAFATAAATFTGFLRLFGDLSPGFLDQTCEVKCVLDGGSR